MNVTEAYLQEFQRQAGKFVKGAAPIRPLIRAMSTVREYFPGMFSPGQASRRRSNSHKAFYRDVSQRVRSLVEAIVEEALLVTEAGASEDMPAAIDESSNELVRDGWSLP